MQGGLAFKPKLNFAIQKRSLIYFINFALLRAHHKQNKVFSGPVKINLLPSLSPFIIYTILKPFNLFHLRYSAIFTFLLCFNLVSLITQAQTNRSLEYVSSSVIQKASAGPDTAPNINANTLYTGDAYKYMIIRRKESGLVEVHNTMDDIFHIQEGKAVLLYGGKQYGGKEDKPGEYLGGKIEGGKEQELTAGDVIMIPAKMPHQLLIKKGETFIYFVTKVKRP